MTEHPPSLLEPGRQGGASDTPDSRGGSATDSPTQSRRTVAWLAVGAIALALGWVAVNDPAAGGYPACAIREWTGWKCAACGGLCAAHEALHLRLGSALALNPLAVLALPLAALLLASELRVGWGRSALRMGIRRGHWMWIIPAVLLVFMVLRNVS